MVKRTAVLLLLVALTFEEVLGKEEKRRLNRRTRDHEAQATSFVDQPHYTHQAFRFGYDVKDQKHGHQYRQEEGDHRGVVKGRYGYKDPFGLYREVEYIADALGFRARVHSNEPGLGNQHPAHVDVIKTGHPQPIFLHSHPIIGVAHSSPSLTAVRAPDAIVAKASTSNERLSTAESSKVIKSATDWESESKTNSPVYGLFSKTQKQSESRKMAVIFTDPSATQQKPKERAKSKFWFESLRIPEKLQQRAKERNKLKEQSNRPKKTNLEKVKLVKIEAPPQRFPYFLPHSQKNDAFGVLSHPPPKTIEYSPEDIILFADPSKQQTPFADTIVIVENPPPGTLSQHHQNHQSNEEQHETIPQQSSKDRTYHNFDIPVIVMKDQTVEPVPSSQFLPSFGPKHQQKQLQNDALIIVKAAQLGKNQLSQSSSNHVQPVTIFFEKDPNSPVYDSMKTEDKIKCPFNCDTNPIYAVPSENKETVLRPHFVQLPCNLAH